jgi:CheY-like chemotaxis protein
MLNHHATQILVVDDDPSIRAAIRAVLEEEGGYAVAEAPNGQAALDWLCAYPTRVIVLLDLQMPVMDGLELLRAVEALGIVTSRRGFILMTACDYRALPPGLVDLLEHFAAPMLSKPFEIDALLTLVDQAAGAPASPARPA